jgi:Bacterial TSP3 repeat
MKTAVWLATTSAVLAGCTFSSAIDCKASEECGAGLVCVQGSCLAPGSTGGSGGSGGAGGGATGAGGGGRGGGGGGGVVTGCDPSAADNASRDTDCDGLTDAEEYLTYHTDPCNADTDGDGLPDGLEVGRTTTVNAACGSRFVPDADPTSKTNPLLADTDGDGLSDGQEDANHDGRRQATETDPLRKDTDCDGYSDREELEGVAGCVTDPTLKDTDGDGLPDGVEGGLTPPGADPVGCTPAGADAGSGYPAGTFDADPTTHTSACNADTDGDGIQDGAEDTNHNGRVDPGELDPRDAGDGAGPPQAACATPNLKPVGFSSSGAADVQVALVPEFAEVQKLSDGTGERGFIFYDAVTHVAGLAISRTPAGADGTAEELAARALLGTVTAPLTQTFSTWDGFSGSVRGTYDVSQTDDAKARINAIARGLVGAGVLGTLSGAAGVSGPFKVQASYVRRTATRAVVVVALVPQSLFSGQALFTLDDVAGGTALAQFGDYTNTQCEVFAAEVGAKVDFLWVVDDSSSMKASQNAVGAAGTVFASKLASAGLDWRAGAVTTGYYTKSSSFRAFTTDIAQMQTWFTGTTTPPWFGTGGSTTEMAFRSSYNYVSNVLLPRSAVATDNKVRAGAALHLIALSDTEDQSGTNPSLATYLAWLGNFDGAGQKAVVHGIICPEGLDCGDRVTIPTPGRVHSAIRATGGVDGDIQIANQTLPDGGVDPVAKQQLENTVDAILSAAIGGTGHQLSRPPISATIKVAIETGKTRGTCNTADVPRDRANGWDLDSATRRIVFYGVCIPSAAGVQVAVSYRFWLDGSPDPNGDACNGACQSLELVCDPGTRTCVCPVDCGGCGAGLSCNPLTCACDPIIG